MTQNENVYAIFCRPEAAGDVISDENIMTTEGCALLNFEVGSFSCFRDIEQKLFRDGGGGGHRR